MRLARIDFEGSVHVEVDTDDPKYSHYFTKDEARGGADALVMDLFYDYARLEGRPFQEGSSQFGRAGFLWEE